MKKILGLVLLLASLPSPGLAQVTAVKDSSQGTEACNIPNIGCGKYIFRPSTGDVWMQITNYNNSNNWPYSGPNCQDVFESNLVPYGWYHLAHPVVMWTDSITPTFTWASPFHNAASTIDELHAFPCQGNFTRFTGIWDNEAGWDDREKVEQDAYDDVEPIIYLGHVSHGTLDWTVPGHSACTWSSLLRRPDYVGMAVAPCDVHTAWLHSWWMFTTEIVNANPSGCHPACDYDVGRANKPAQVRTWAGTKVIYR